MNTTNTLKTSFFKLALSLFAILFMVACGDDDPGPGETADPAASFQFEIDGSDFFKVNFTNFSQNATSYTWDFGDTNTSTEESPSHTYAAAGDYTVTLSASNGTTSAERSETITITDPNAAEKRLTGQTSKTWKLFREGISMSLGPNADSPTEWWAGLANDGGRPCAYEQEWTFNVDGTFDFNDAGEFWAEFGIFNNVAGCESNVTAEQCLDATAANMVNACGDDVSAWLSGSHTFEYDVATNSLRLNGLGAWIGIPKLGTDGETLTPVNGVSAQITIEEFTGYDVMLIEFIYAGAYWPIRYASYSDPSLEPALVTETTEFGMDLDDITPNSLSYSFAEGGTSDIDTIVSGSVVTLGVADPAGGTDLVGEFFRTEAQFQELQFQTSPTKNDINFANLTNVSVDVYLPSANDYTTELSKNVIIGLADKSRTEQWWTDHQQYERDGTDLPEDEWVTLTFELNSPTFVANTGNGNTPYDRNDYDMIFLNIGSSDHTNAGTFYVRNLRFN